jgi:carbon-monoxide dehydrogenase large subunit
VACRTKPLGVTGPGDAATTAAPPAVMNAIIDALPKGTWLDMPATSERIWQALRSSQQ